MDFKDLIFRYTLMLFFGIFLNIFYLVFSPLTIYSVYILLSIFYKTTIIENIIIANNTEIEIINACVAGSAYFLLFILNFSTAKIKFKKRIFILLADCGIFLLINILRIFFLSVLLINNSIFFNTAHFILWYAVSILLVILIWIFTVKFAEIKEIPFISDFKKIKI
ncbi:MAG: pacearchaeosortase [Candidatus Pacearchaeota archaeon]